MLTEVYENYYRDGKTKYEDGQSSQWEEVTEEQLNELKGFVKRWASSSKEPHYQLFVYEDSTRKTIAKLTEWAREEDARIMAEINKRKEKEAKAEATRKARAREKELKKFEELRAKFESKAL